MPYQQQTAQAMRQTQPGQQPTQTVMPPAQQQTHEPEKESLVSRIVGNLLTFSMTLSMVLTPFAFLYVLQPDLMNRVLELPFPIIAPIAIVYILVMLFLGMRLAAIFGCGPWYRAMRKSPQSQD